MTDKSAGLKNILRKEFALLVGMLFVGLVLMPIVIYLVGQSVFGAYGGQGYTDFFGNLSEKIRAGGCEAYLAKPITVNVFIDTVRKYLS